MPALIKTVTAFTALAVLVTAAGCGSSSSPAASPSPSSASTSTSSSPSPAATRSSSASRSPALSSQYTPPKRCLLTKSQVSSVLGGTWQRKVSGKGTCTYSSDRGAIFAVQPIDEPPSRQRAALADARVNNCGGKKPRDVPGTGGAFTCLETASGSDPIEGNIIVRGYYWLFVAIGMGSDPTYPAQTKAIAAVLKVAAS